MNLIIVLVAEILPLLVSTLLAGTGIFIGTKYLAKKEEPFSEKDRMFMSILFLLIAILIDI